MQKWDRGCLLGASARGHGEPRAGGWVLQEVGIAPSWHPIVITHLSGWTAEEIEGLSRNPAASFSLPISAVVIEPGRSPPPSLPRSILRGNAALCPGNEILTHPTLFTIPDREERRGDERKKRSGNERSKTQPNFLSHLQKSPSKHWDYGSCVLDWKRTTGILQTYETRSCA